MRLRIKIDTQINTQESCESKKFLTYNKKTRWWKKYKVKAKIQRINVKYILEYIKSNAKRG